MHPHRSWLWPAIAAAILFLGGVASDLVAADLQPFVEPYRGWVWGLFVAALVLAIGFAVRDLRRQGQDQPNPRLLADHYTDLRRRYLDRVTRSLEFLPLRGIDFKTASAETGEEQRLRLSDVYVSLDTTAREQVEKADLRSQGREERSLSALAAVVRHQRAVLLGAPGSGKSTFVNHLAFCLASDQLDPRQDWIGRLPEWPKEWASMLPVPIALREIAAWFQATQPYQRKAGFLQAYLGHWLGDLGLAEAQPLLCDALCDGTALLLLDGLDEVSLRDDTLARIKEMITDLPTAYPRARVLVTCRVLSYQDPQWQLDADDWPTFELDVLNDNQIDQFVRAWYDQLVTLTVVKSAHDARVLSDKLSQAVRRPDLWQLAPNPLLLTVMALVHTHKGELPDARALLYEDVVDLLLWRWEAIKLQDRGGEETTWRQLLRAAELNDIDIKQTLWRLAYEAHGRGEMTDDRTATADIAQADLLAALRELHPERSLDWAEALVRIMQQRAGLLIENRPGVYSFPHRTFQEYLAGRHLSSLPDFPGQAMLLADEGVFWWEVILLAVGWLVHSGQFDSPLMLVNELCPEKPVPDDATRWRRVWLAGRCLKEIGTARAGRRSLGVQLATCVPERLIELISNDHLSPRERAEAGSVLGALGDARDLDEMVAVPAGPFLMGSDKRRDKLAYDDELPQHTVTLRAFRIAKYPVTNGQFAAFVAATGRPAPDHWRGNAPPPELRNHPVVNVTWHDAVAFCAWLSRERGQEIRLPTEAEWERAARHTDGRIYPWGNVFDAQRCNMAETGIGGTSPVGIFRAWNAVCGAADMAGNVWEWTSSLYKRYKYDAADGREDPAAEGSRVLRGGSFGDSPQGVRCAYRLRDPSGLLERHRGFRVVSPGF